MNRIVCRFTLEPDVLLDDVEELLLLSLYGAEGIHGAARVRLESGYLLDGKTRTLVVDVTTPVGETVVQLFTGYLTRDLGEDSFRVEKVDSPVSAPPPGGLRSAEAGR